MIVPDSEEIVLLTVLLDDAGARVDPPMLGLPVVDAFVAVLVVGAVPMVDVLAVLAGDAVADWVVDAVGLRAAAVVVAVVPRAVELDDGSTDVRLAVEAVDGFLSSTELVDLCDALEDVGPVALDVGLRTVPVGGLVGGLLNPPVAVLETDDDVGLVVPLAAGRDALAVELVEPRRLAGAAAGFLAGTFSFFTAAFFAGLSASVVSTSVVVLSPAVSSPAVSAPEVTSFTLFSSCDRVAASVSDLSAIFFFLKVNRNLFVGAVIHQK